MHAWEVRHCISERERERERDTERAERAEREREQREREQRERAERAPLQIAYTWVMKGGERRRIQLKKVAEDILEHGINICSDIMQQHE